jgi:sugar lactone lactonase YvrE
MKNQRILILFLMVLGIAPAPLHAQPPAITNQPASRAVWTGANVAFAAGVSAAGPLSYQWQFNGKNLTNNIITTVAGGGVGDGGAATRATLNGPAGVAVDASGNLFIADTYNNRIREVSTNGIITTVAGNGDLGDSGNGGPATSATLFYPTAVAVDLFGNLFIGDVVNYVRKVSANGTITTVAGGGAASLVNGERATNATLSSIGGLAVNASGSLFIADSGTNCICKVSANGILTIVAGILTPGYSGDGGPAIGAEMNNPNGLAFDASGNLFIADTGNNVIRKLDPSGNITTVAGNGTSGYAGDGLAATNATLNQPSGVVVDTFGNLFIADSANEVVRKVGTNGLITTFAKVNFYSIAALAVDAFGDVFMADSAGNVIVKIGPNGFETEYAGGGPSGAAAQGFAAIDTVLAQPNDVAVDASGNLFIADTGNNCIRKLSIGGILTTFAGNGSNGYSGDHRLATVAELNEPTGVAVDAFGNLFIADGNSRVRKVSTNGIITTVAGGGTKYPGDGGAATNASLGGVSRVLVDAAGNVLISEGYSGGLVQKVTTNGIITTLAGGGIGGLGDGGPATNAGLGNPQGMALDASGNLFIADAGQDNRIRKVTTDGIIVTVAYYSDDFQCGPNLNLSRPSGVAVDAAGNLFIADTGNNVIREINTYGLMTMVAGPWYGPWGAIGDGGAATNASLHSPFAVALDASGNLLIADSGNNRIRKVTNTQGPSLALSDVNAGNAGNYKLVVTGPGGPTTSSVASLSVATSPLIYQAAVTAPGSVALDFVSLPGSTNVVLSTTDLSPPILWQPLSTNVAGPDGDWQFIDTNAASYPARFYLSRE